MILSEKSADFSDKIMHQNKSDKIMHQNKNAFDAS